MQHNELILLGKIIKVHGFNGAVVIALEGEISEKIKEMESVFVEIDGKPVPFFFEWQKDSGPNTLLAKFDYFDSEKSIIEFVGCEVFTDREIIITSSDSQLPIFLTGYTLMDSGKRVVGEIIKVVSFPMQVMLELKTSKEGDILIPYNEDWIIELDETNKSISLNLPEGLDSINN